MFAGGVFLWAGWSAQPFVVCLCEIIFFDFRLAACAGPPLQWRDTCSGETSDWGDT